LAGKARNKKISPAGNGRQYFYRSNLEFGISGIYSSIINQTLICPYYSVGAIVQKPVVKKWTKIVVGIITMKRNLGM